MLVGVVVKVGVDVNVEVGMSVGVLVDVEVKVKVGMKVGVLVGVEVNVKVGITVEVLVGKEVGMEVGGLLLGVEVMVNVGKGVGVDVGGGAATYQTSTERKSTYPPEAVSDHVLQPAGTVKIMLTKPGRLPPVLYKYQFAVEPQALKMALPTLASCVKATIASK